MLAVYYKLFDAIPIKEQIDGCEEERQTNYAPQRIHFPGPTVANEPHKLYREGSGHDQAN